MGKRKPSAYNRHVGREMKAGKTMKQAAASWKGGGASKTRSAPRKARKVARRTTKRKTSKRSLTLGGYGPMGILKATALYLGVLMGAARIAPAVTAIPGGVEAATGGVAMVTGLPGNAFLALGAAKFVANVILRGGIGVSNGNGGGYDY